MIHFPIALHIGGAAIDWVDAVFKRPAWLRGARLVYEHGVGVIAAPGRADPLAGQVPATSPGVNGFYRPRFASSASISSITRVIAFIVRSSGSPVVMSTPAAFSKSIGYLEPPALKNARYLRFASASPFMTFSASAADAVNDVAY